MSKRDGDFYWLSCLHSFRTKKPHLHKKLCKNKDLCGVVMSSEETKILEFNQYYKFYKTPSINYAELDF